MLYSVFGFSQSTTTQSNGVVVHQAQGVETPKVNPSTGSTPRSIEQWSLAECIDALSFLEMKLEEAYTAEDKEKYTVQRDQLLLRINELKQGN